MNKQLITVIEEPVGIVIKPPAFVPRNYTIVETGSGDWTARTPNNEIIDYAPTANLAEDLCIRHAARNLRRLARANGYVKLEPGQVVVQTKDLTRIVTWFRGDARTVPHADMDTTLNRFAAALDAIKEARDE